MPSLFKKQAPVVVEAEATAEAPAKTPEAKATEGKGRATPKRKDAQAARRTPAGRRAAARAGVKPGDPKAAKQAMRAARRARTAEYRAAMNSGDVSKLPPKERAPERIMARDIVDQRRNLGPPLLALILIAYVVGFVAPAASFYLLPLCLIAIIVDSVLLVRKVTREVTARYPNPSEKFKAYAAQRAILPARWRQPRPRPNLQVARWIQR